jgi:hypothetical protein
MFLGAILIASGATNQALCHPALRSNMFRSCISARQPQRDVVTERTEANSGA